MTTHLQLTHALPPRLARWAPQLLAAELCYGVDPWWLAAILDRESLGGEALDPKGPAGFGDKGHGRGLGQIDDRAHPSFVGARFDDQLALWTDPTFNILYAARLLAKNLGALKWDYPAACAAYNAGLSKVKLTLAGLVDDTKRLEALDSITTGKYVADVIRRRATYLPPPTGAPA